jgi:hypothetical protein
MKTRTTRRLVLARETVRVLRPDEAATARGGYYATFKCSETCACPASDDCGSRGCKTLEPSVCLGWCSGAC